MRYILWVVIGLVIYGLSYSVVVGYHPQVAMNGTGYADWCRTGFYPLFLAHAAVKYRGPYSGNAVYDSANRWGDKVFIIHKNRTYGGYLINPDHELIQRLRLLKTGTGIEISIRRYLDTDSANPRLSWSVESINSP